MNPFRRWFSLLVELTKFRLSIFIVLSTATGFVLGYQGISLRMVPVLAGVFLLASGASALNQYQERREDLLMERTKGRPIPSGRLSPLPALYISSLLLGSGCFLLYAVAEWITYGLGVIAVLLYNGVYTPLKKKTLFAVVPGALVGAIPPAIGWSSGGGGLEPQIFALCLFFFLWQIPHSWLLLLDFQKDYQEARFPSLVQTGEQLQVEKISWVWIFATVVCSLLIPLFGIRNSPLNMGGLLFLGFFLTWRTSKNFFLRTKTNSWRFAFRTVNFYMLAVMALFSLDQLFQNVF